MLKWLKNNLTAGSVRRCPYCMERLDVKETYSICPKCGEVKAVDGRCPTCKSRTAPVCRYYEDNGDDTLTKFGCGNMLPAGFWDSRDIVIAFLGGKAVGKSQYLQILFCRIMNELAREFKISAAPLGDKTRKLIRTGIQDITDLKLVDESKDLDKIGDQVESNSNAKFPYMFNIQCESPRKKKFDFNLVVYDTPGEDLYSEERILKSNINNYVNEADAIVYLVDPVQIKEIRDHVNIPDSEIPAYMTGAAASVAADGTIIPDDEFLKEDSYTVFSRVLDVLKKNRKGNMPKLAFVMTKVDVLRKDDYEPSAEKYVLSSGSGINVLRDSRTSYLDSIKIMDSEMRKYFADLDYPQFIPLIEPNFEDTCFFAASSLGQGKESVTDMHYSKCVAPFRLEDPLLWILSEMGITLAKK